MPPEITVILTALAIYAAGAISPGPSFTLILRLAASGARPAAFGATVGFSIGAATYATLAMTGFALVHHAHGLADERRPDRRGMLSDLPRAVGLAHPAD